MSSFTKARVLKSFLEYRATYGRPLLSSTLLFSELAPAVFESLEKWDATLENFSWKHNPANAGEVQAAFHLAKGRISMGLWLGYFGLFVTDPAWEEAGSLVEMIDAATASLTASKKVQITKRHVSIWMHLRPEGRSRKDITGQFVRLPEGQSNGATGYGLSVYRGDSAWVVDTSALFSDALFVKINRTFASGSSSSEVAEVMRKEEGAVLSTLGLEVD
jgi:hypothetical protein